MTATNEEFIRLRKDFQDFKKYKRLRNHSTYSDLLKKMTSCAIALAEDHGDLKPIFWLSEESIFGSAYTLLEPPLIETYLKKGVEQGDSEATRVYAEYLWKGGNGRYLSLRRKNRPKAIELIEKHVNSDEGNNSSRLFLAEALVFYDPTPENISRSREMFLDLIGKEYTPAYDRYYRYFLFEAGAVRDRPDEAFILLSKAYERIAKQTGENWKPVMGKISFHLGLCYAEGIGCSKNMEKAKNLIRISLSKENRDAYYWLKNRKLYPRLGASESTDDHYDVKSFTPERFKQLKNKIREWSASKQAKSLSTLMPLESEAVACAKYLAERKSNIDALFWLSDNYFGPGVKMRTQLDEGQYESYLCRAAEKGHQGAQQVLARYYAGLSPVISPLQVDLIRAAEWMEKAAATGGAWARSDLVFLLLDYRAAHTQDSLKRAERLLKGLIAEGDLWALFVYYDKYYFQNEKIRSQPEEAFALLQKGKDRIEKENRMDKWSQRIFLLLGLSYAEGVGCKKDIGKAAEYMRKSVAAWHEKGEAYWWLQARNLLEDVNTEKARKA
ncbi:MAG: sel1 repeat family protein [Alphaproteobacteria bacterium]|nr:sel1 repeat family protein [Alphaproteobacteria bacterium]QQS57768.1 MAG: sel1 repeat family protein [Alphaproteobacteria bacterium]